MELIGISGYARSGKDTAAGFLIEEFGFQRVAFADKLRDFLYALNPIVHQQWDYYDVNIEEDLKSITSYRTHTTTRIQDVIDEYGWDGYKSSDFKDEVRSLLQRLGTEAGRETLWDTIWIDAAFSGLDPNGKYVITDCRFPNEAKAIKERGGQVWRVERKGIGPATAPDGSVHPSETSLDDHPFNVWVHNDGTLQEFRKSVKRRYLEGAS